MWELYAFWAFIPYFIIAYNYSNPSSVLNVSLWSFLIIGIGSIGCVLAGKLSLRFGSKKVATTSLFLSGLCCVASPFLFQANEIVFVCFMLFWGLVVIADSPMFSTLVAQSTAPNLKGTALTIVNCIGFTITILSIQFVSVISEMIFLKYLFLILTIGPLFGFTALLKNKK